MKIYYETEGLNDPILISFPNRAAPALDGTREKRWIVAETRSIAEPYPPATTPPVVPILPNTPPLPVFAAPQRSPTLRVKFRKGVIGFAAIVVLGVAAYIAARTLTANYRPQSGRIDNSEIVIMNTEGKELWHKSFSDELWPEYYDQGLERRLWIGDLDGNGRIEVLFLYHPAGNPYSHSTTLICFSDRGQEKWRWTPGRVLPEFNGTPVIYLTFGFVVLKAGQSGHRQIVVSSQYHPFYPDQIAIVDSNGKTVSEYWHSGVLRHLALADLDGDGRQEIIASGISNGYHQATLIVLDPNRVFGASMEATRPEIQLHGMGVAQERVRLLFPRSDLNKVQEVYNEGKDIAIDQDRIRLLVSECSLNPNCDILYEFDKSFHLRDVTPADFFRSAHKQFYLNRKDDHPFSAQEEAELQKVRCLVGCKSEFVPVQIP
jgi:hypothetical protein